jgi:hypothetical protein
MVGLPLDLENLSFVRSDLENSGKLQLSELCLSGESAAVQFTRICGVTSFFSLARRGLFQGGSTRHVDVTSFPPTGARHVTSLPPTKLQCLLWEHGHLSARF